MPISNNYYEASPTRFELDNELIERLRHLGILYDYCEEGEYFHIYPAVFADRFFFEIVQRVCKYNSYGASNAPARMAPQVQKREGIE